MTQTTKFLHCVFWMWREANIGQWVKEWGWGTRKIFKLTHLLEARKWPFWKPHPRVHSLSRNSQSKYLKECWKNKYNWKTHSLPPVYGCFNLTNRPKLRYLLSLAASNLGILILKTKTFHIIEKCFPPLEKRGML